MCRYIEIFTFYRVFWGKNRARSAGESASVFSQFSWGYCIPGMGFSAKKSQRVSNDVKSVIKGDDLPVDGVKMGGWLVTLGRSFV